MAKRISILIPVFNEEGNIDAITAEILEHFPNDRYQYEILFVNDGSIDNTLQKLKELASKHEHVFYISFSRNFGKDNALLAGLQHTKGDAVITMDADLQHPPPLIGELIKNWEEGYDVVYTYRSDKNRHVSAFSRLKSKWFYKIFNRLSDINLEEGIADFRIIDKKVVAVVNALHEDKPFFRGLIKWVGFNQKGIPYVPNERFHGQTTYSTGNLLKLALQGITSFSTKPLLIAIYAGLFISILSLLYIPYVIISLHQGYAVSGWASIIVTITFFGGIQLMILGIIGIYLGKLFMQSKQRPQFIIEEKNIS